MMIGVAQVIGMKPTLRSFFSSFAPCPNTSVAVLERKELRDRGERGRGADAFQEGAARGVLRKHRAHHRGGDHALVALLFARGFDRLALQLPHGVALVLDLTDMAAAGTAGGIQSAGLIEGIVESGHRDALHRFRTRAGLADKVQWPCQ